MFIVLLMDQCHTFITEQVGNLFVNPSFLQQAEQEELKGMIQMCRTMEEVYAKLAKRVTFDLDLSKSVHYFAIA